MKNIPRKDIYESSKYIYVCLKLVGLAPYRINRKTRQVRRSVLSYVELVLVLAAWITFASIQTNLFKFKSFNSGAQSSLLEKLWQYLCILQHFLACLIILFNFWKCHHVEKFLNLILNFDDFLQQLNWKLKPAETSPTGLAALIVLTAVVMVLHMINITYIVQVYGDDISFSPAYFFINIFSYTLMTEFYLLVSLQFIWSTHNVYTRLQSLTRNFNSLTTSQEGFVVVVASNTGKEIFVIRNVAVLYDTLADAVDEINSIFSKQVRHFKTLIYQF